MTVTTTPALTGVPAPQSSVAITGGAIDGTTIGATTPATGSFTTLTATGLITPSTTAGIKGTTLGDNANAGSIGERTGATGSAVSLTSTVAADIASVLVQPGDWVIYGVVQFNPAGTTPMTAIKVGVSTTSATFGGYSTTTQLTLPFTTGAAQVIGTPLARLNISVATTLYLVASSNFTVSTCTADCALSAVRMSR